jgi:hypothetical protein
MLAALSVGPRRDALRAYQELHHLNDAGFRARFAGWGREVQSASGKPFQPPRLGLVGHGKEQTKSGQASLSVAQTARFNMSRGD